MDPALRAFINYGIPLLSLGLIVAIGLFVMAYLRRRQASEQVAEIEEAILKKLTMPTLEELDGELPGADPFAPGADNTDGMNIRDKQVFLAQLEKRKKRWQDANVINLDPNEILEEKVIDAAVTGYLYAGKYEKDPGKASVVAVGRRAKMQEKGRELLGDNAKGLEEFYTERADALVLAGNRLPESRTRPLRVLDGRYDLDDALQDRQLKAQMLSSQQSMGDEMPERIRRTYRHEAIKLEAKPKGLKRIKKALNLGPKEEEGEESIEVAV